MNWEIYHIILPTGEHYVGQHCLENKSQDFSYLGSGSLLKNIIKSLSFSEKAKIIKEQLKITYSPLETNDYEKLFIYLCRKTFGDKCINVSIGGNGKENIFAGCKHSILTKQYLSKIHKGRIRVTNGKEERFVFKDKIPEGFVKVNNSKKYIFITDGKTITTLLKGKEMPKGFYKGSWKWSEESKQKIRGEQSPHFGKKPSKNCREATSKWLREHNPSRKPENKIKATQRLKAFQAMPNYKPGNYGKHYYNNGKEEIFLSDTELIPDGFIRGRLKSVSDRIHSQLKGIKPSNYKKCCYSNGVEELWLGEEDIIPEGFYKGRTKTVLSKLSKGN